MPWTPQNEFEEEILKLQPDHNFIYGHLSEPQHPRPTTHTDYATTRRLHEEQQQKEFGAGSAISSKLRMIQQVQKIANSKPVGEQPSLNDWDTNENLARETIGMMRHFGMGANVEQPLNEEVTIATQPLKNTGKIVKNGRRSLPLFLDDNIFKLREKLSPTLELESCSRNSDKHDSVTFVMEGDDSLSTSTLSFDTATEDCNDSFSSAVSCLKTPNTECYQYAQLLEDTSSLSLDTSKISSTSLSSFESYKAFSRPSWLPIAEDYDDDDDDQLLLNKKENWPSLSKTTDSCDTKSAENNDSTDDTYSRSSEAKPQKEDFLDRLLKSIRSDLDSKEDSNSATSSTQQKKPSETPKPPTPITYAAMAKAPKATKKTTKKKESVLLDSATFPAFYSTRKMYALKRAAK